MGVEEYGRGMGSKERGGVMKKGHIHLYQKVLVVGCDFDALETRRRPSLKHDNPHGGDIESGQRLKYPELKRCSPQPAKALRPNQDRTSRLTSNGRDSKHEPWTWLQTALQDTSAGGRPKPA